jgi:hypothetical protein
LTPAQENYLQVERLVLKALPYHLWNRRVWPGELAEWNIIKPAVAETPPTAPAGNVAKSGRTAKKESNKPGTGIPYTPRLL